MVLVFPNYQEHNIDQNIINDATSPAFDLRAGLF